LITADAVGGVWQYAIELARELRPLGFEAVIALLGPAPSAAQRALAQDLRLVETGLPLDWLCEGPAPVLAAGAKIAALAKDEGVDLVQLNMPTLAAAAPFHVPVLCVTHGCVATWWEAARNGPLIEQFRWHEAMMRDGLHAADEVVAPTRAYGCVVRERYGLLQEPRTVHNGRRPLAVHPAVPHDHVLTVGRLWDPVKNAALLDQVASRLPFPFHAAGATSGPHAETVKLDHLGLLGEIDELALADALSRRPVFASAANFEPFGLAVLEAAGAGCALVLSDIGTFRELWDGAALFVPPGDEDGFVHAIENLIGDDARRRELAHAAQQRAGRYTPLAMAGSMARIYAQLAPGSPGRAAA
jgi:glycosyltransferase involved in cell wall biosynthesis